MPKKLELTIDEQKGYFATDSKMRHCYYEESIKAAKELEIHCDGIYPGELITCRRPNESEEVKCYREKIFVSKTEPYYQKILAALDNIRRSVDWDIRYDKDAKFPRIPEGESLYDYCEENFPGFGSFTNWVFAVLKRTYTVDPNAVIFNYPSEINIEPTEFLEPFPHIFESCHVLDFAADDYAVLVNPTGCMYRDEKGNYYAGKSFYFVTTEKIYRYDQISSKEDYTVAVEYEHKQGGLPVYRLGAIVKKSMGKNYFYKSRLAGVVPEFNEALREYSDLQAAKVLHMFPTPWIYTQTECTRCKGKGFRKNPKWTAGCDENVCPQTIKCDNKGCVGGYIAPGPYDKLVIKPNSGTDGAINQVPLPPAGEVEKNPQIIEIQDKSVQDHIYYGLASLNFEFLAQTPLAQSGVAKATDRDAANTTVHSVAEDLVRIMDWWYLSTAKYRYSEQYPDEKDIKMMVPKIPVPQRYDILSASQLEAQMKSAKDNNANATIINAIEVEYASKAFNTNQEVRDFVELVLSLDPLANITEDNKNSRLQNKGITMQTYIVSSNIDAFVQRALEEVKGFADMEEPEQRKIIFQYAQDQIDAEAAANEKSLLPAGGDNMFDETPSGDPGAPSPEGDQKQIDTPAQIPA